MMRLRMVGCLVAATLSLVSACNLMTPLVFVGRHNRTVAAEFDKLANRRVAVLVWTDRSTLFDYPHARFELAAYIGDKLYTEMTQRNLGTDVVDPRDVETYLQKNLDAQIDPRAVGRAFDADYVIYVEIVHFQIRDPRSPQLLQGRIDASVSTHDMAAERDQLRRFELTPVKCLYPEGGPVPLGATNSRTIREATYVKFGEMVARKFYEYTIEM